jgi:hypothetical protein
MEEAGLVPLTRHLGQKETGLLLFLVTSSPLLLKGSSGSQLLLTSIGSGLLGTPSFSHMISKSSLQTSIVCSQLR